MTNQKMKDVAHSVRSRLLTLARSQGRHNQDMLINVLRKLCVHRAWIGVLDWLIVSFHRLWIPYALGA